MEIELSTGSELSNIGVSKDMIENLSEDHRLLVVEAIKSAFPTRVEKSDSSEDIPIAASKTLVLPGTRVFISVGNIQNDILASSVGCLVSLTLLTQLSLTNFAIPVGVDALVALLRNWVKLSARELKVLNALIEVLAKAVKTETIPTASVAEFLRESENETAETLGSLAKKSPPVVLERNREWLPVF